MAAWSLEAAAVAWSRSLGWANDSTIAVLGEGAHLLPIILASAVAWLGVQLLVVPICRLVDPSFVRAVQEIAVEKAKARGDGESPGVAARAALSDVGIRSVALVFSILESYGAVRLTLFPPPQFEKDPHLSSDPLAAFYCAVAAGYFLWDLPICLYYQYGPAFIIHASFCLVVELIALHPFNQVVMTFSHLFELSTPFLNLRVLMISSGRTKSLFFTICEMSFGLLFLIVRILYGYVKTWEFIRRVSSDLLSGGGGSTIIRHKGAHFVPVAWFSLVLAVSLCLLNGFWFYRIVALATGGGKHGKKAVTKED